jgi:hypothetical protein
MDRFVAPRAADNVSSIHGEKSDLLALMMAGKSENKCNGISNQVKGWENASSSAINSTTINCSNRTQKLNTSVKGWKIVNGEKTYTTFRNGSIVRASGFAGFQLSAADTERKSGKGDSSNRTTLQSSQQGTGKRKPDEPNAAHEDSTKLLSSQQGTGKRKPDEPNVAPSSRTNTIEACFKKAR